MRATKAGHFHAAVADTVVLTLAERMQTKATLRTVAGETLVIDLAVPPLLGRGDGYLLEDGRMVEVLAAPEPLMEIRVGDAHMMSIIAYALGKEQQECEISPRYIRLRRSPVLRDALLGMGAKVIDVEAPFQPEGTAPVHTCNHHDHHHDHGHHHHGDHNHGHGHDHKH